MKAFTINGELVKLKGLARSLDPVRLQRAVRNAAKPSFNEKFSHPRRLRMMAKVQKP